VEVCEDDVGECANETHEEEHAKDCEECQIYAQSFQPEPPSFSQENPMRSDNTETKLSSYRHLLIKQKGFRW